MKYNFKNICFITKAFLHFIYVFITPFLLHKYHLKFVKYEDNNWYIDLPNWPFEHENLEMVAGADKLCEELSNGKNFVNTTIITSYWQLRKKTAENYIKCSKSWAKLIWGGQYFIPKNNITTIDSIWLCQVTLFVIGWWPKYIYIKNS